MFLLLTSMLGHSKIFRVALSNLYMPLSKFYGVPKFLLTRHPELQQRSHANKPETKKIRSVNTARIPQNNVTRCRLILVREKTQAMYEAKRFTKNRD